MAPGIRARTLGVAAAAVVLLSGSPASAAEPEQLGTVEISPAEGGSTTPFSVDLPRGAACPGDSADDGYRVNTYMIPASADPAAVVYDGLGPSPMDYGDYATFKQPLFDVESNSFVSAQTADADDPGAPGPIVNVPEFSFEVYVAPGYLPAGRYHVGIACTLNTDLLTFWDAEIVVTDDVDDDPAQIHWRVIGGTGSSGDGGSAAAPLAAGAVVVAAGIVALIRRRSHSRATAPSMEDT